MTRRDIAVSVENVLEQAEGFVRSGNYCGALDRARYARELLRKDVLSREATTASVPIFGPWTDAQAKIADTSLGAQADLAVDRYALLLEEWQAANAARGGISLARERRAIGADAQYAAYVPSWPKTVIGWGRKAIKWTQESVRRRLEPKPQKT